MTAKDRRDGTRRRHPSFMVHSFGASNDRSEPIVPREQLQQFAYAANSLLEDRPFAGDRPIVIRCGTSCQDRPFAADAKLGKLEDNGSG